MITIPGLELLSAVTGARLARSHILEERKGALAKATCQFPTRRSPTLTVVSERSIKLTEAINLRRFSSPRRLLGGMARMKRFIDNCRRANDSRVTSQVLSIEELKETREWIVKAMQKDMKGDAEYEARTRDLAAYLHMNGFIRCGGRLTNTSLTFDRNHQILLPTRHKVSDLIVQEFHQRIGHEKVSRTLAEVRA
eukprot:gene8355-biopygen6182